MHIHAQRFRGLHSEDISSREVYRVACLEAARLITYFGDQNKAKLQFVVYVFAFNALCAFSMPRQPKSIAKLGGKTSKNRQKSNLGGSGRLWVGVLGLKLASRSIFVHFVRRGAPNMGPCWRPKF